MRNKDFTIKTNARRAMCSITGESCHRGDAYMVETPDRLGGYGISKAYFAQVLKNGKGAGRPDNAQDVTEPHNIQIEFNIALGDETAALLLLLANGWTIVKRTGRAQYRIKPAVPVQSCRGLQQWLTTFDRIVAQTGSEVKKTVFTIDGQGLPEGVRYTDSLTAYASYDRLTLDRRTTTRENPQLAKKDK